MDFDFILGLSLIVLAVLGVQYLLRTFVLGPLKERNRRKREEAARMEELLRKPLETFGESNSADELAKKYEEKEKEHTS